MDGSLYHGSQRNGKEISKGIIIGVVVAALISAGGWLLNVFVMGYKIDQLKEANTTMLIKIDSAEKAIVTNKGEIDIVKSDLSYLRRDTDEINKILERSNLRDGYNRGGGK